MNINSSKPPEGQGPNRIAQPTQNVQKPANVESKDNAAPVKNASPQDRVNISSRSKEIADITSAINQLPDIRTDRVQEIQKSIEAGTYSVDSSKVANKILKSI
jgi:negative regulator of flagellin synthesis FlgM